MQKTAHTGRSKRRGPGHLREQTRSPSQSGAPGPVKSSQQDPSSSKVKTALSCVALFAGALALYVSTLAPGVTWRNDGGDGGDLLAAAHTWGVPHPTGYPAYIIALRSFSTLAPLGSEAYRGNLFSAVCAAAAVSLVFLAARTLLRRLPESRQLSPGAVYWFALAAAATFAASSVLWSQAVITEVYALNALFVAVLLWLATEARARLDGGRSVTTLLVAGAFIFGLGLGNHVTLAIAGLPLALWVYWPSVRQRKLRPVPLWRPAAAFLLGLAIYVYPPVASSREPAHNWGHPHTLEGFRWMITATIYQNYAFGVEGDRLPARVLKVFDFLLRQFTVVGVVLGLAGLAHLWARARSFAVATAVAAVAAAVYAVGYSPADSYVYLIPAFLIFSVWLGAGAVSLASTLRDLAGTGKLRWLAARRELIVPAVTLLALAVPAYSVASNYGELDLSGDTQAADHARNAVATAGPGAVIVADGAALFSLWYQSLVEEPEREVLVVSAAMLQFEWYWDDLRRQSPDRVPAARPTDFLQRIQQIAQFNEGHTAVFLTHDDKYYSAYLELEPAGELFRVKGIRQGGGA